MSIGSIRVALARTATGPWSANWDSCDCGDGYGCAHGSWIDSLMLPKDPALVTDDGRVISREHSELRTLPVDTAAFLGRAPEYVRVLLARIDELEEAAS